MKEDKDIKILFLINKSLLPKYNKNGDIIESNEKEYSKKQLKHISKIIYHLKD